MDATEVLHSVPVETWHGPFPAALCERAVAALEQGRVLLLPALPFAIATDERMFLDPASLGPDRKNVTLDPATGRLGNAAMAAADATRLTAMLRRFADASEALLRGLLPGYAAALQRARTSFRPAEIEGRASSPRHDDRLLHVDAFPTRPMRGRRILRVFSNVAPDGALRHWRVGEPFEPFAARFAPRLRAPLPGAAWMQAQLGLTHGIRSRYDQMMLGLHDAGKLDAAYQASVPRAEVHFPAGASWLCFTDQVMHAALAGHCALEQTFYLPVAAMADPARAPLRVLERLAGRALV